MVFRYDYSIWSFLSVVSESDAAQKGLWSGQLSCCGQPVAPRGAIALGHKRTFAPCSVYFVIVLVGLYRPNIIVHLGKRGN